MSDTPRTDAVWEKFETDLRGELEPDFEFSTLARQLERELNTANDMFRKLNIHALNLTDRIKRLEEELMDTKNKHAVLVADVVLNEDRAERIKQLEDRIHRASMAFFRDGSDGQVASSMLAILEEERGKQ